MFLSVLMMVCAKDTKKVAKLVDNWDMHQAFSTVVRTGVVLAATRVGSLVLRKAAKMAGL